MASVDARVENKRSAAPVEPQSRVRSVDMLRGVALLGILAVNIVAFAWPDGVESNPLLAPDAGAIDVALWAFNVIVFNTKMMSLFSMLFGAGVVLMVDRAEARGTRVAWIYYRRIFWLLVIGLIHAYLIWGGDILVAYAACGFLLYPLRKLRPRTLIVMGLCLNLVFVPVFLGLRAYLVPFLRETAARAESRQRAGQPLAEWETSVREGWKELTGRDSRAGFVKEIARYRSSYSRVARHRARELIWVHLFGIPLVIIELSGGRMLIGMGLMKLGVFSGACSKRTYVLMVLAGYGAGLPLMGLEVSNEVTHGFFADHWIDGVLQGGFFLTLLGSLPVVFGHIGAAMLVDRSNALPWLTRRLAAVGQMALSNYLFHSLLFTTVFYGYGLDLYGSIGRPMLWVFVLLVWAFQLWLSPVWLASFRYGPAEWVWRSLTYGRLPFLKRARV